jgi:hypothetical protein
VDSFLEARLRERGLTPTGRADRRTLLRRLTFDLTGLPPTPEETDAFLADHSPLAWTRLVDRLLASPAYGEKWGRYWLDIVRYADTAGETADFPTPEAWRYRNYVIQVFNSDKPWDDFLREQLAGDLLAQRLPADASPQRQAELLTATGYLAIARRFGFDSVQDHYLTLEDTIDVLGKSLLGLTVGCARCHDHKYDPVTSADYYALYGIFESTRYPFAGCEKNRVPRDLVPLPTPPDALRVGPVLPGLLYAVAEGKPHNARVQLRGDPTMPGPEVPRRFLTLLGGQLVPPGAGSGRRELAEWVSSPKNPLTARVLVNRIWQHHFGVGLVDTPNDFGTRGSPPSHPELLDWLAANFVESGWSVKRLHRLIVHSAAYQRASSFADPGQGALGRLDPDNRLLGHFSRRRLQAEEIRDALLAVAGELDRSPGGPHPFPVVSTWAFTQHAPFQAVYEHTRRGVYLMTQRIKRHPFLALFDGADPSSSTPRRHTTTVPTQALYFLNDPFVHARSATLAGQLLDLPDRARLERACQLLLGRPARAEDHAICAKFRTAYLADLPEPPSADRQRQAWSAWLRVQLASNEFLYVD